MEPTAARSCAPLTLAACDGNGYGVRTIRYHINDGPWEEALNPFIWFTSSGVLRYYAEDIVGNLEPVHEERYTLIDHLSTPTPLGVPDGSSGNVEPVTLSWSGVPDATHYQFQVDDDPGFGSPVTGLAVGTDTSLAGLTPGIAHRWRVRAHNLNADPSHVGRLERTVGVHGKGSGRRADGSPARPLRARVRPPEPLHHEHEPELRPAARGRGEPGGVRRNGRTSPRDRPRRVPRRPAPRGLGRPGRRGTRGPAGRVLLPLRGGRLPGGAEDAAGALIRGPAPAGAAARTRSLARRHEGRRRRPPPRSLCGQILLGRCARRHRAVVDQRALVQLRAPAADRPRLTALRPAPPPSRCSTPTGS